MTGAVSGEELASFPGRPAYPRGCRILKGYRHGHRDRKITATSDTETRRGGHAPFTLSGEPSEMMWSPRPVDREAWHSRDLAGEDIVRSVHAETDMKTRIDGMITDISLPAAIGARRDGQKVSLSIANMGGGNVVAWGRFIRDPAAHNPNDPNS